ncbi:MAG: plasmid pRiA4b ORF-3 family protein [Bacillota bacterium]
MSRIQADGQLIYQLKVTLCGVRPPVWRRIQVRGNTTLLKLNHIIQAAMGWLGGHLFEFQVGQVTFGEPDPEWDWREVKSARRVTLHEVAVAVGPKGRFRYVYDFGDDWRHNVVVEKVLLAEQHVRYPICLAGRRACPPEDCGGPWGYAELLEAVRAPEHPEHGEMTEWLGGDFDPEEFDLEATNRALASSSAR